jgi:hypothetical protein
MVNIQPIEIWISGQIKIATELDLVSINDNLSNQCLFLYVLSDSDGMQLATGNITMIEPDYTQYVTSTNSNDYAYQWGASTLGLTIIP